MPFALPLAATSIDHLRRESQTAFVADHLSMLSAQFLASSLRPSYPLHAIVTAPSGLRLMKRTLQSSHFTSVEEYLQQDTLDPAKYPDTLKNIHTKFVRSSINLLDVNPIPGAAPPPIAPSLSQ